MDCEFNFQVHLSWCVKKQRSTGIFPLSNHLPHVEEHMKEYRQLTLPQRYEISALHKAGPGPSQIADWLGRTQAISISHERIYQHIRADRQEGGILHKDFQLFEAAQRAGKEKCGIEENGGRSHAQKPRIEGPWKSHYVQRDWASRLRKIFWGILCRYSLSPFFHRRLAMAKYDSMTWQGKALFVGIDMHRKRWHISIRSEDGTVFLARVLKDLGRSNWWPTYGPSASSRYVSRTLRHFGGWI